MKEGGVMNDARQRDWLSITEAVQRFPVGRTLLYQEIAKGTLPHIKVGGKILIPADAFDRLLQEQANHN